MADVAQGISGAMIGSESVAFSDVLQSLFIGVAFWHGGDIEFISTKREVKLPESLKQWLILSLAAGAVGAFGYLLAQIIHGISDPFWKYIAPAISVPILLSLCCLQLLAIVLLVIWVIYLHRSHREPTIAEKEKQIEDRFDKFDSRLGLWTHKTQPGFFCTKCKASHFESPLRERPDGWSCAVCGKVYENPDYRPPPKVPPSSDRGWKE
jgi:hypothetical protein